jgi:hypothetical protein
MILVATAGLMWACGFDDALREYLSAYFWLPFAMGPGAFEKPGVRWISARLRVCRPSQATLRWRSCGQHIRKSRNRPQIYSIRRRRSSSWPPHGVYLAVGGAPSLI